eukprot:TRINITY_DN11410_c0_g1_i1.p1 TRINITY_DN11410_c0_g1~~TRINITY_DN11410_c0_g1_i1.p1  ORF type:complete len:571 (+),score=125.64 TRINITY_DN11410_c0_g1_i1:76-1713(+)
MAPLHLKRAGHAAAGTLTRQVRHTTHSGAVIGYGGIISPQLRITTDWFPTPADLAPRPPGAQPIANWAEQPLSPRHSELRGERSDSLPLQPVAHYLAAQARRVGRRPALRVPHQKVEWTFRELKKKVDGLAHSWLEHGIMSGNRILSLQPLQAEAYLTHLAAARLSCMAAPLDPFSISNEELALAIDRYQATCIVSSETVDIPGKPGKDGKPSKGKTRSMFDMLQQVIPDIEQVQGELFIKAKRFPSVRLVMFTGMDRSRYLGQRPVPLAPAWGPLGVHESKLARVAPMQISNFPLLALADGELSDRAIVYTHANAMAAGVGAARRVGLREGQRAAVAAADWLLPVGSVIAPHACLAAGACAVLLGGQGGDFLDAVAAEDVTGLFLSRGGAESLLPALKKRGGAPATLEWVCIFEDLSRGGQPLTKRRAAELRDAFGVPALHVFSGPLEAATALTCITATAGGEGRPTEVTPGTSLRVVGDEGGPLAKTLGRDRAGWLRLKGPAVTPLYFNNAGMLSLDVDQLGFSSTPHDATLSTAGQLSLARH